MEWKLLPLWSPHLNHRDRKVVKCKSLAHHRLSGMGITCMGDVLTQDAGEFIPWSDQLPGGGDRRGERAYLALLSNLPTVHDIDNDPRLHRIFFAETGDTVDSLVWQFDVPPEAILANWRGICEKFSPKKTFRLWNGNLLAHQDREPNPASMAHRILIRFQSGSENKCSWFGPWCPETVFMEQYGWLDDSPLLNTSTAQLRKMQSTRRLGRHSALPSGNCILTV